MGDLTAVPLIYYDDGHWKLTSCPDEPKVRLHVYTAHAATDSGRPFPECWRIEALSYLRSMLIIGMTEWVDHHP